jgi:hypothetical protein
MIAIVAAAWPPAIASAQTPTTSGQVEAPAPAQPPLPNDDQWGEKTPPKNYVRSKEPAKDGHAYNWTQMAYASAFMACMGLFIFWLIRRNQRDPDPK